MVKKHRFIFWDKKQKRWKKIVRVFMISAVVVDLVAILGLFSVFFVPRFGYPLFEQFGQNLQEVIDAISTQKEDVIQVEGSGTFVTLEKDGERMFLKREEAKDQKRVVLTFDDGPDPTYTPQILEILKKESVPATFFVVGEQMLRYPDSTQKIIDAGSQIGLHTFSHPQEEKDLYSQQNSLGFELDFPQKILTAQTGYTTNIFRVPYWGTEDTISLNSLVLTIASLDRGYMVLPSTTDSFDWRDTEKDKVVANSLNFEGTQVILLHDGGGDRNVTIAALPEIIKQYKRNGYTFVTTDGLLDGRTAMQRATLGERIVSQYAVAFYLFKIYFHVLLNPLFKFSLGLIGGSIGIILILSIIHATRKLLNGNGMGAFTPFVSVIVPAYNEEKTIAKTIGSLLASDYPSFEIIIINNNSKDDTRKIVKRFVNGKVKLVDEPRQGKFAALNRGIKVAKGDILVALDADTQVLPDTISEIVHPFGNKKVGAVAGNVKVGNVINLLTAFQSVEYTVALQLDRRAYDVSGAVPVVPGALGAWRKKALQRVGGYKGDTLTEDAELTIRLQRAGYKVVFVGEAVAYTEAPETISSFLKQRLRWTLGILQVLYKYRDVYFRPRRYGTLAIVLPYMALVQLPAMLIAPLIDTLAVVIFFFVASEMIVTYFLGFMVLNTFLTLVAFGFAREGKVWLVLLVPLGRIFYQGIWYYILYRSVLTALRGSFVSWAKLKHKGSVSLEGLQKTKVVLTPDIIK